MFSSKVVAFLTMLVAVASGATNDVFRPQITAPKAGDVWTVGTVQTIAWDTSNIPAANQNQTGLILLGFIEDGSIDEHLNTTNPLASNFPITAGSVSVNVPDVTPRDDYVVVLFGDSGNTSPQFSIVN
ncbi:hypothetical protein BV20DRAFT_940446 [Pilatotrama ljubarskyi]|nr:hypothetical protein BV20DRAFT_940446 [Pilatotrama ljubarskyi]